MTAETSVLSPPRSSRRPTGKHVGHRALIAQAAMANGKTVTEAARLANISRTTATALKQHPALTDPAQVERIRQLLRDKATLKTDLLLDHVDLKRVRKARLGEIASAARALAAICVSPEQANPGVLFQIQNNYGLQPSHSASEATVIEKPTTYVEASSPQDGPTTDGSQRPNEKQ